MRSVRYAWRTLAATPVVSTVAILTMALGIGTATTVFSVADGVLLRPLPYPDPAALVMVWDHWTGWPATWLSNPELLEYQENTRLFSAAGGFIDLSRNLTGGQTPERVHTGLASAGVFRALGVAPALGRSYTDDEDHLGGPRVAVISDALWRRRFNSDPQILGKSLRLDDSSTTIIGVMPAGFHLPLEFTGEPVDIWQPLALGNIDRTVRGGHYLNFVGRLRSGVAPKVADQEVQAMARQMLATYPSRYPPNFGAFTRSVTSQVLGDVRPTVFVITAAVAFVLLIACANVANLLLARAHARQREMAVRASLGASPWQIIRQLLTEAGLLAGISGSAGILLAVLGVHLVAADAPRTVPRIASIGVNVPVLLFALGVTVLTGLACGILPALHAARPDLHVALKERVRTAQGNRGERARRVLIAAEVALSVMLLVGAGLLTRSFARLLSVDPGFDPAGVVTAHLSLPTGKYPTNETVRAFYRELVARTRALPGVSSAAVVRVLPMTNVMGDWSFRVEGRPVIPGREDGAGDWQVVSPDYLRVMHMRLIGGRPLNETDDERAPGAVMVNQALAERAWPGGSPIGQRIRMGAMDTTWRTVAGVVANVRHRGLDADPRPEIYLPHAQWLAGGEAIRDMYVVMRTVGDPESVVAAVPGIIRALDPDLPVASVRPMNDVLSDATAARRVSFIVMVVIAAAAVVIAAVGLYGVVSYAVEQRTPEIGIRRALGATAKSIVGLVVREGARSVVPGVAIGLAGAMLLGRFMASLLFEVRPTDAVTFAGVPVLIAFIAVVATCVPARRAAEVDPLTAMRAD